MFSTANHVGCSLSPTRGNVPFHVVSATRAIGARISWARDVAVSSVTRHVGFKVIISRGIVGAMRTLHHEGGLFRVVP